MPLLSHGKWNEIESLIKQAGTFGHDMQFYLANQPLPGGKIRSSSLGGMSYPLLLGRATHTYLNLRYFPLMCENAISHARATSPIRSGDVGHSGKRGGERRLPAI